MAVAFRAAGAQVTGTTSVALGAPAGISAGDLLLAFIVDHTPSASPSPSPSGWTLLGSAGGAAGRFQVFWMLWTSGTTWTFTSMTTNCQGEIVAYSGVNQTTPIDTLWTFRQNASGTTGTLSITPTTTAPMVVAGFCSYVNGTTYSNGLCATNPTLTTKRFDSNNSTVSSMAICDAIQNGNAGVATGASSITMTTAGANAGVLFSLNAAVPIQLVQSKVALNNNSGTSTAVTITSSTAGNLIVVAMAWDSSITLTSVVDNLSNTYSIIGATALLSANTQMQTAMLFINPTANAGGITTITATTSAPSHLVMEVLEFSGIVSTSSLDVSSRATATTANSQPGAVTTTQASELVISWIGITSTTAPTSPVPYSQAGVTQPAQFANDLAKIEYQITSFTGTFGGSGTWSSTNVTNNSHIATFKAAAPPSGTTTPKSVAGTLTFTGTISKSNLKALVPGAGLTFTGTVAKFNLKNLVPGAGLTFTGIVNKRDNKALVPGAGLTFTGIISKRDNKALVPGAGLTFTGTIGKFPLKALAGAITFVGIQTRKTFHAMLGALTFTGTPTKQTTHNPMTGTITFTGTIAKRINKAVAGALTFVGTQTRQIGKTLSGVLTTAATLGTSFIHGGGTLFTQSMFGGLAFVGSLQSRLGKLFTGALSFNGAIAKRTSVTRVGVLTFFGAIGKAMTRTPLTGALSFTGTDFRLANKITSGAVTFAGGLRGQAGKLLAGATAFFGSITRSTSVTRVGNLTFTGNLFPLRTFIKVISGALTFVGLNQRQARKILRGTLTFFGFVFTGGARMYTMVMSAVLGFAGKVASARGPGSGWKISSIVNKPVKAEDVEVDSVTARDVTNERTS